MITKVKLCFLLFIIVFLNNSNTLASSKEKEISIDLTNTIRLYKSGRYIDIIEYSYNFNFKTMEGMLLLAKSYENMGYYNRAFRKYKEIYTKYPRYKSFIYYFIAELLMKMNNYEEAAKWYNMTILEFKKIRSYEMADWNYFFRKSLSDIYKLYKDNYISSRELKRTLKSIDSEFIISTYYLAMIFFEEKSYKKSFSYLKKIINSEINRYYKIELLKKFVNNEETLKIFLDNKSLTLIELLRKYDMDSELLKVFNFVRNKRGRDDQYEKEIASIYYKIGDYKNALILFNRLYHETKDPDFLINIAYSYYNINRKKTAKRYLYKYLSIQKYRFKYSFNAFYLKILFEILDKNYQNTLTDMEFVIKKYGSLMDMDRFVYKVFYLLMGDNQVENAIKLVFLYYPFVKHAYYKSWSSYILGLYLDSGYFYNSILSYPGSFYYFKSTKYIKVSQDKIKVADRYFDVGDYDNALRYYILLYAKGFYKKYTKARIRNILEKKSPYKYLLRFKYLNNKSSFIYRLYNLGLFNEIKNIFFNILETVDNSQKYFIYYLLSEIYYNENDYKKGLLYAEIISSSLNYIIFLPNDFLRMLYPLMYEKEIKVELSRYNWFVDECFIMSIIREESRYDKTALSNRGAVGLMQLMPDTATWIYNKKISRKRLLNPEFNIKVGIKFLNYLYSKFTDHCLILASYNGGPTNVIKWMRKYGSGDVNKFIETIPFSETRNFIKKVYTTYNLYKETYPELCGME